MDTSAISKVPSLQSLCLGNMHERGVAAVNSIMLGLSGSFSAYMLELRVLTPYHFDLLMKDFFSK